MVSIQPFYPPRSFVRAWQDLLDLMDSLCAFVTQKADVNTSLTAITTLWSITDFIKRACLTDACANVVRVAVRLRHHALCVHTKACLSVCLSVCFLSI